MKRKLTKTVVQQAQPASKRYEIRDTEITGFMLRVAYSGKKDFYLKYKNSSGQAKALKLGSAKELHCQNARELAEKNLLRVRNGEDPAAEKQEIKIAPTIAELKKEYMIEQADKSSLAQDSGYWNNWLLPAFGKIKVRDLTRSQVRAFMKNHPKPPTANRCYTTLRKAFEFADEWGWIEEGTNPCYKVKKFPEEQRQRYIEEDELFRLKVTLQMFDSNGLNSRYHTDGKLERRFAQMIRLLLLTGARLRNIMEARWEWVNWKMSVLVVPVNKHKTGSKTMKPLMIHLSDAALEILKQLKDENPEGSPWIISGQVPHAPLVGYRKHWLNLCSLAGIENLRVHDLRHSHASQGISAGMSLSQIGELLGHKSASTTKRYAHLEKSQAQKSVNTIADRLQL